MKTITGTELADAVETWERTHPCCSAAPGKGRARLDRMHASKRSAGLAVQVIRNVEDLEPVQSGWDSLALQHGSPMLLFAWARTCAEVFGLGARLEILLYGTPVTIAVAPLFRTERDGRRCELLGASELGEPMNFLYSDASAIKPLADTLARSRCSVLLRRLPADSPIIGALKRAYRKKGFVVCRPASSFPRIPLDQSWIDPESHLNAGRRSDLRRLRKMAAKFGETRYEVLRPRLDELTPLLDETYEVEASGWKGASGSALAFDGRRGPFFRRFAAAACRRGILRLCFLRIGGKAAAAQLAIEMAGGFWLLKIGYREEFARCSPGTLLVCETIRYAAGAGLRSYEFLGADQPWLHVWSPVICPCVSVAAYPWSARGLTALGRDALALLRLRLPAARRSG